MSNKALLPIRVWTFVGTEFVTPVFHELVALALCCVGCKWHAGPPCLPFGTLRRPRLRSKARPASFDPSDALTALRNLLARRTAVEQPGGSVMLYMQCFIHLALLGGPH